MEMCLFAKDVWSPEPEVKEMKEGRGRDQLRRIAGVTRDTRQLRVWLGVRLGVRWVVDDVEP